MRIAIVDDIQMDREKLRADICKWAKENQIPLAPAPKLFSSGEALLESLTADFYDIIFLDIYMGGMTGMETARHIRERDTACSLIFTTQTADFAVESYEVNASWYLIKPYTARKLAQALSHCRPVSERIQTISIPGKSEEEKIFIHDIVYTEYENRCVTIHMKNGDLRSVSMRQKDFAEALLKYPCFCDCMKGILVNFESVEQMEKDRFLLKNGHYIPISRLKYASVREQFLQYSYAKLRGNEL